MAYLFTTDNNIIREKKFLFAQNRTLYLTNSVVADEKTRHLNRTNFWSETDIIVTLTVTNDSKSCSPITHKKEEICRTLFTISSKVYNFDAEQNCFNLHTLELQLRKTRRTVRDRIITIQCLQPLYFYFLYTPGENLYILHAMFWLPESNRCVIFNAERTIRDLRHVRVVSKIISALYRIVWYSSLLLRFVNAFCRSYSTY